MHVTQATEEMMAPILAISVEDAAKSVNLSRAEFYRHLAAGTGPKSFHVGRRRLFRVTEIRAWFERLSVAPMDQPCDALAESALDFLGILHERGHREAAKRIVAELAGILSPEAVERLRIELSL